MLVLYCCLLFGLLIIVLLVAWVWLFVLYLFKFSCFRVLGGVYCAFCWLVGISGLAVLICCECAVGIMVIMLFIALCFIGFRLVVWLVYQWFVVCCGLLGFV